MAIALIVLAILFVVSLIVCGSQILLIQDLNKDNTILEEEILWKTQQLADSIEKNLELEKTINDLKKEKKTTTKKTTTKKVAAKKTTTKKKEVKK